MSNEPLCTCGHPERQHLWPPPSTGSRQYGGWSRGGCKTEGCACKVFDRDRDYIPPSKALTPRELSLRLTRSGAAWMTDMIGIGRWRTKGDPSWSESMTTRIHRAIEDAAPYAEGGTLERLKGGELGAKAWTALLKFLREREYVFGDDKPCPTCGRKGPL